MPTAPADPADFSRRLLAWYDDHGRHDLPWKRSRDRYRIWVSEIMLQQTRVETVLDYYARFLAAFPDVHALARAEADAVLALWAGLGYYARARNLHRAAQQVVAVHGGDFPDDIDALTALPGIGRSTAAAILALSSGARHAICDGNVRRVLSRVHRVEGDPAASATQARLWRLAEAHTPDRRVDDYTQAIMDLGATVCMRRPRCALCPVRSLCAGFAAGDADAFPWPRTRRARPRRQAGFLLLRDARGRLLLERRPPAGIWGGLWCPPEVGDDILGWIRQRFGTAPACWQDEPPVLHGFTHFELEIRPRSAVLGDTYADGGAVGDQAALRWHDHEQLAGAGLPAPFRKLIDQSGG